MLSFSHRIINDLDLFKLSKGEYVEPESFRLIEGFQGVAWEIELKETDKDIEKKKTENEITERFKSLNLGLWSLGGESEKKRKIVIMALPKISTSEDLCEEKYMEHLLEDTYLEEIVVDRFLNQHKDKFGYSTIFFHDSENSGEIKDCELVPRIKLLKAKTFENLCQKITNDGQLKEKFVGLGQKIVERIKSHTKDIYNEEERFLGFVGKVTLEEYMERNKFDFSSNYDDLRFYLSLYYFLLSSYNRTAGNYSFKESVIETLEKRREGYSKEYDLEEVILEKKKEMVERLEQDQEFRKIQEDFYEKDGFSLISQYKQKIKNGDKLEEKEEEDFKKLEELNDKSREILKKYLDELNECISNEENKEGKHTIDFIEFFKDSEEKFRKNLQSEILALTQLVLEEEAAEILKKMSRMLTEEGELDLIKELSTQNKAWREGDLKTLVSIFEKKKKEVDASEIGEIAKRVVKNINENKSSLFITSLPTVVGSDNLISILQNQGHKVVPVVNTKPVEEKAKIIFYRIISEEGMEVGGLLGTIHEANKKMLEINPSIHEFLNKSDSIYLEVAPEIKKETTDEETKDLIDQYNKKISNRKSKGTRSKDIEIKTEDEEKWEAFVEKAFPILFEELKIYGATSEILNSVEKAFQQGFIKYKVKLVYSMIGHLARSKAGIAVFDELLQNDDSNSIGIEDILEMHAFINKKKLDGLENDDSSREELGEELDDINLNFKAEKLPENGKIKEYLQDRINFCKKLFDNWIDGNEDFFIDKVAKDAKSDGILHKKLIIARDEKMAEKMIAILKSGKEIPFFAVGTAHLFGIMEILKKKGYKFERV